MTFVAELRTRVIRDSGASGEELGELLRHSRRKYGSIDPVECLRFPLSDETFMEAWDRYSEAAAAAGSIAPLAEYLPQLGFPIQRGISRTEEYIAALKATHVTKSHSRKYALSLIAPERCRVRLHPTPAGRMPAMIADERQDFITLVRAFTGNNEPVAVSEALQGIAVSRVKSVSLTGPRPSRTSRPVREVLRGRFLIVSSEPYRGVRRPAAVSNEEWRGQSALIRCEHQSAHYFTRRLLGSMRNALLDELIAHFYSVVTVLETYRAQGLFDGPQLEDLRGDPPLSDGALRCLLRIVRAAAGNLETFQAGIERPFRSAIQRAALLLTVAAFALEELASPEAPGWLMWEYRRQLGLREQLEAEN